MYRAGTSLVRLHFSCAESLDGTYRAWLGSRALIGWSKADQYQGNHS
jgi:hypothetical protein